MKRKTEPRFFRLADNNPELLAELKLARFKPDREQIAELLQKLEIQRLRRFRRASQLFE